MWKYSHYLPFKFWTNVRPKYIGSQLFNVLRILKKVKLLCPNFVRQKCSPSTTERNTKPVINSVRLWVQIWYLQNYPFAEHTSKICLEISLTIYQNNISGECSKGWEMWEIHTEFWLENLNEKGLLEDPGVDGLKHIGSRGCGVCLVSLG